ncbi:MAG TPA: hypothetical protein VFR70_05070, partial [Flavobacterium sp.]|nr:hypothetical protein [Flavobacterium sp.]
MKKITSSKLPLIAISSLILFGACQKKEEAELHSGLLLKNMDTLVKPGDNFHAYVNGNWIKNTEIPADKPSYGAGFIVYDKAEQDVKEIIEAAAKGKFKDGSDEQKIGDFYASFMDTKTRDAKGVSPLKEQNSKIEAIKTYSDLAAYFGESNQTGQTIPFSIFVSEDAKNPKEYILTTWQSGLGLPEREYYLLQDDKSKALRAKYEAHIAKMLTLGGYANPAENAAKILALETLIASKHMKK